MSGVGGWKSVEQGWQAVDDLIGAKLLGDDPVLADCLARSHAAGLPDIAVSAPQGRLLELLAAATGARRILEVGTLGGFSTILLARGAGPEGRVTTLELLPEYARVARGNLAAAAVGDRVEVIEGPALDNLARLEGPFDLTFIDADKVNNCAYVDHAVRLSRAGALIVVDNVVRQGHVVAPDPADDSAVGTRALYDHVRDHPRLAATAIQTVGSKGWDGLMVARVLE
jgi:predicted O-methyltransferase YrrM